MSLPMKKRGRDNGELTIVTSNSAKRRRPICAQRPHLQVQMGQPPATLQRSTLRPQLTVAGCAARGAPTTGPGESQQTGRHAIAIGSEQRGLGLVGRGEEHKADENDGENREATAAAASAHALTRRVRWADAVAEAGGFGEEEAGIALNCVVGSADPLVNRFMWCDERGREDRQELLVAGEPSLEAQAEREQREHTATAAIMAAAAAAVACAAAAAAEVGECSSVDASVAAMRRTQVRVSVDSEPKVPCRTAAAAAAAFAGERFSSQGSRLCALEEANARQEVCH